MTEPIKARRDDFLGAHCGRPMVVASPLVYTKAMAAMFGAPDGKEVGMLLSCSLSEDGVAEVEEIYIPHQTISGGDVDFNADHVAECEEMALDDNRIINGWWHSHGHFGCIWSNTDIETMEKMRECFGCGFVVSVVTNQRGDIRCRIDVRYTSPLGVKYVHYDDLPFQLKLPQYNNARQEIWDELDAKVSIRKGWEFNNKKLDTHTKVDKKGDSKNSKKDADDGVDDMLDLMDVNDWSVRDYYVKLADESHKSLRGMRQDMVDELGSMASEVSWDSILFHHARVFGYSLDTDVLAKLDFKQICTEIIDLGLEKDCANIDDEQAESIVELARNELEMLGIDTQLMDDRTVVKTWKEHVAGVAGIYDRNI